MRVVSFSENGRTPRAGVVVGEEIVAVDDIEGVRADVPALVSAGADVRADVAARAVGVSRRVSLQEARLHAPITRPSKYLAIGFNFTSHLKEIGEAADRPEWAEAMERFGHLRQAYPDPQMPTFFNKQVSCITGPFDPILAPLDSDRLDYEGELVVVIGRPTRRVSAAQAMGAVAGYMVGNDVSVRDWQQDTPTMWPGKSFDTHGPLGPWIVSADELDPSDLRIRTWVDGELRQDGSTAEMVTGIAESIAALSRVCSLEPGDLIATGTPGGVGLFTDGLLRPGQRVRVEIDGIGAIENTVVPEEEK